jgi:hypothetical protein
MNCFYLQYTRGGEKNKHKCLSCGVPLRSGHQRYCTPRCRQQLKQYLNRRTGLLVALNTRYATFYFTDLIIVLDILPYGANQIFSFMLARTPGNKPVADFCDMFQALGSLWWSEKNRTHKRYIASLQVLGKARRVGSELSRVMPKQVMLPAVRKKDMKMLRLEIADLGMNGLKSKIKTAYRCQAKKHHPDLGGNAAKFRNLQEAYEKMIQWAKNPSFFCLKGFPDKWHYEGSTNRWIQPASDVSKISERFSL